MYFSQSFNQTFNFNSPSSVAGILDTFYRVLLKSDKVGLFFFSSIKLLWCVFGTASERNNTRVELSRPLWNSQSALVSIRSLPDLVSSSPFPSPLPCFLSSNRQNEIWGRDQKLVEVRSQFKFKKEEEKPYNKHLISLVCSIIHTSY